eukprot:417766_1
MTEYKINRRAKDIDDMEDELEYTLAEEAANKLAENGCNGELFVEVLIKKLRGKGIINNKEFEWKLVLNANKNKYDEKSNGNDEKEEKEERLSQLINVSHKQMCIKGHGEFSEWSGNKCIKCPSKKDTKYCDGCYFYDHPTAEGYASGYTYCIDCRIKNGINIQKRIKMNELKSLIIRNELLNNPRLELDLLCEMKRRA